MKSNTIFLTVITILFLSTLWLSYSNSREIDALRQENAALMLKIDSVQRICCNQSQNEIATPEAETQSPATAFLDLLIKLGEEGINAVTNGMDNQKVAVSSKYSLEDRYVSYKVEKPDFLGDQAGKVVLNIWVDYSGDVKSAKLKSATGITNEDVIEACKKAALKTQFNYDSDRDYNTKQVGTITYIFSEK